MILSPTQDTQAVLLLCARLGQQDDVAKPLNTRQYAALARWLHEHSLRSGDLLRDSGRTHLGELRLNEVGRDQVERLLDRGAALGVMVERWTSSGIWVITQGDDEYPPRYKTYLQHAAPPVIYGVGEHSSLQKGGLAIVGSRHASEEDMSFAQRVGEACAEQRISAISGAAKGIDSESMTAAINRGGSAIGVLAEGLGRAAVAAPYHEAILDGRLTLISPYEPDSRWFAYTAMDRNKLIYALADAALIVACSDEEGGTWSGAVEALKRGQIPLYVKDSGETPVGNRKLIQSGAHQFPPEPWSDIRELFQNSPSSTPLFGSRGRPYPGASTDASIAEHSEESLADPKSSVTPALDVTATPDRHGSDAYNHIVEVMLEVLAEPMSERSIAEKLNVPLSQARVWLKRAVEEGRVQKSKSPVRYARTSAPLLFARESEASVNKRS